jgi:hypothetical protein
MPDPPARQRAGSCLCRAIRFVTHGEPRFVAHCHCANCRRAHGAGVITWTGFPREALVVAQGDESRARYVSETGATWSFCTTCGTRLFYETPDRPDEVDVPVAALDDELDLAVSGHAYAAQAPAWCPILDDLPQFGASSLEP